MAERADPYALRLSKNGAVVAGGRTFYVRFPTIPDATTAAYFLIRGTEAMRIELLQGSKVLATWTNESVLHLVDELPIGERETQYGST